MESGKQTVTLTEANFASEVLESTRPVLVDFWAEWCAPCRQVTPVVEELARRFEGRATVAKLNVDDHPGIAQQFNIRSIPSLLFFRNGEPADRVVGVASGEVLAKHLESTLETA